MKLSKNLSFLLVIFGILALPTNGQNSTDISMKIPPSIDVAVFKVEDKIAPVNQEIKIEEDDETEAESNTTPTDEIKSKTNDEATESIESADTVTSSPFDQDFFYNPVFPNNRTRSISAFGGFTSNEIPSGCVEKLVTYEEIIYDEVMQCQKIVEKKCYQVQETTFTPYKTEICDEMYNKNCYITFQDDNSDVIVEVCHSSAGKYCDEEKTIQLKESRLEAESTCVDVYETVCETVHRHNVVEDDVASCTQEQHPVCTLRVGCPVYPKTVCSIIKQNVTKTFPETECKKIQKKVCGPNDCPIRFFPEICANETKRVYSNLPIEKCSLTPKKVCKDISSLVPSLQSVEKCMDIPKEVCSKIEVPRQNIATAKRLLCDSATFPPAGTTTYEDTVALVIGGNGNAAVELYSPNGTCFGNLAPLPFPGTNFEVLLSYVNKKILACGGPDNKACWIYNIALNTWTQYTVSTFTHNYQTSEVYNDKLYIVDDNNPEVFDPATNTWSSWPAPPKRSGDGPCLVVYQDSFLMFGGYANRRGVQRFNHSTIGWVSVYSDSVPTEMVYSGCILLPNGQDVLIVGSEDDPYHNSVSIYNIESNSFTSLPQASINRAGTSLVRFGSRIFAIDGDGANKVEEFNYENRSWIPGFVPLKTWRAGHQAAVALPKALFANYVQGCTD